MTFDPRTSPIEADLSRADVVALWELAAQKRVVEFGAGGSTALFARTAASLYTYDTSPQWLAVAKRHVDKLRQTETLCTVEYRHCPAAGVPPKIARGDLLFIDGYTPTRAAWMKAALERQLAPVIVAHDTRRLQPVRSFAALLEWPLTAWIDSVHYHYQGSNLLVVRLRDKPVQYSNWNQTEKGRAPHLRL
jgi:hypothetical protein